MSIQVKLIGVNHKIQHGHPEEETDEKIRTVRKFAAYLKDVVNTYNISMLAEEFNRERCEANHVAYSTVQAIADVLKIAHLFCEPSSTEKQKEGIRKTDADYDEKRELFWLKKLMDNTNPSMKVVFVCGYKHLDTFKAKLETSGIRTEILSRGWGDNLPEFIPPF